MKKLFFTATVFLLTLALLAGCNNPQTELPGNTTAKPETETTEVPTTETIPAETKDETQYEGDATSYHIDVVYAQQIRRYYTAISQQWDAKTCLEHELSPQVTEYYDGKPLDNIGFTFMDLDGDGIWELIIGAIRDAEQDPRIFEVWAVKNDQPVMLIQSAAEDRHYLQYAEDDNLWTVAYEAKQSETKHGVYSLLLMEGKFEVMQGVIFDAAANEKEPWFMAYDLDWDVSNDTSVDEDTAKAVIEVGRNTYVAQEYFPYSLYK